MRLVAIKNLISEDNFAILKKSVSFNDTQYVEIKIK